MARRTVGKPRFFADIPSYLKVKGYFEETALEGVWDNSLQETNKDSEKIWTFDPSLLKKYNLNRDEQSAAFKFIFDRTSVGTDILPNKQLHELITNTAEHSDKTGLYGGILGHTCRGRNSLDFSNDYLTYRIALTCRRGSLPNFQAVQAGSTNIKNYETTTPSYNGYSLWEIDGFDLSAFVENTQAVGISLYVTTDGSLFGDNRSVQFGAVTYGRWFEPEHSLELKASVKRDYEGFKTKNTIGGNTLINIDHLGVPNWGDLPAWTLEEQEGHDYFIVGNTGRRSWMVALNFMADDNILNDPNNNNQFFKYDETGDIYTFDESMSSFFGLTMGGRIPFLFCPDIDANNKEFAKCIITKPPTYKQVANNLFSTNFTLTEVY